MLSKPTLSNFAVSFSPFVSLLIALVELAIANLSLFYCSGSQHLTFQQAIAHSTIFYPSGQLPTTNRAIANFNLFSFSTKQAIAAVLGQGYLLRFQALCGLAEQAF